MIEQLVTIMLVAIVLGADSFSLAMGMGLRGVSRSYELKFSGMVCIFHILMPLIGLNLGIVTGNLLGIWAGRLGAVVLAYIGGDMLWKAYCEIKPQAFRFSQGKQQLTSQVKLAEGWLSLMMLTTSVSIDALTVGFSLGTLIQTPLFYTVVIIGLVAGAMTLLGFKGGKLFSAVIGSYAQMLGGLVLLLLAVKMAF
ncbi:MAG: manganese efflux pump [Syntrophomonas sp.]|nr:manganese efflux pump [Syntrophomonas sp.]